MKTFTILLLSAVLLAVGFFSRPSQHSFEVMIQAQAQKEAGDSTVGSIANEIAANQALKDVTYKNRFLWTDVQKDGKTLYTGAVGHWFQWGKIYEAPTTQTTTFKLPKLPTS